MTTVMDRPVGSRVRSSAGEHALVGDPEFTALRHDRAAQPLTAQRAAARPSPGLFTTASATCTGVHVVVSPRKESHGSSCQTFRP